MGESLAELRGEYEDFLRGERYNLSDRIATAVDDFAHIKSSNAASSSSSNNKHAGVAGAATNTYPRVSFSMAELRSYHNLSERLRLDPLRHLRALEAACLAVAVDEKGPGVQKDGIKVALTGPVGAAASSPRQLTSSNLRQLVCVEGVATKVSTIKPKVVKSVHYCPQTKQHLDRNYVDATDPHLGLQMVDASGQELPDRFINITTSVYPTKDENDNPLETEYGYSVFKDHQTITLQEMPEKAPMGQLPRSVELILDHDMVDRIKPGDRVMIMGVYRALATASQGQQSSSGVFRTVVLVNNVQILGRDVNRLNIAVRDLEDIRSLSKRKNILDILGRSIAPSIHGHEVIKKALALQLFSGVEKNLDNGTHLRGDINILMVGDPSTAKSQLLRAVMTIAPLAVSTTGKGSSGVGLTAAVTSDPDTKERRLEAGAMVLADRGIVCVDEFDKMGENDRVAIHEAMEQQTVTIAKAGIHASLNARCSVLAAANPVYGQYDRQRRMQENIGLPDSLLSRFDLLFVVLDQMDPETDRKIASHVIRGHRSLALDDNNVVHDDDDDDDPGTIASIHRTAMHSIWQRNHHATTSHSDSDGYVMEGHDDDEMDEHANDVLQLDFLRKYLFYAKERKQPVLTEPARDYIASKYAEMRARQDDRTIPITARSLETVIRLATAHAKLRLSDTVLKEDCEAAMNVLAFALYHEQSSSTDLEKITTILSGQGEADEGNVSGDQNRKRRATVSSSDEGEGASSVADDESLSSSKRHRGDDNDVQKCKEQVWMFMKDEEGTSLDSLSELVGAEETIFQAAISELESEGRIMISDGTVYNAQ